MKFQRKEPIVTLSENSDSIGFYRRNSFGSLLFRIREALLYYRLVNHNSRESNTKLYLNIDKPRNTIGYVKLHANRSV